MSTLSPKYVFDLQKARYSAKTLPNIVHDDVNCNII